RVVGARRPLAGSGDCTNARRGRSHLDGLDVEAYVEHVAVLHDVGLALEALPSAPRGLGVRAGVDEVVPANDLAADEATRDVRVDRLRRVERRVTVAERPLARLLLCGREEGDQVELLLQAADDLVERRRALAELGRLVRAELCQLGLELEIDAAG